MNNKVGGIKFKSTSRYLLVLGLLVGSLGYTSSAIADNKAVSIYVDGRVQTISTSKNTVEEALSQAGVEVLEKDSVEPAKSTKINSNRFNVNVYRARMVTVVDGVNFKRVLTSGQSGKKIALDAGINVTDQDKFSFSRVDEFSGDVPPGEVLTIKKAKSIKLNLYGKDLDLKTHAVDVADLLKEQNIKIAEGDELSLAQDAKISDGLALSLSSVGREVVVADEEIAFPEEIIKDADKEASFKEVQTPGVKGRKTVTYQIVKRNGQEESKTVQSEVVISEPTKQVVIIGSKSPVPAAPSNPAGNVALGQQLAASRGWGDGDQWSCLYNLWQRESGWRTEAHNPSGAHGLPQALPGSKMGAGWENDPAVQINWGLGYIAGRYGTPCNAYNIQRSKGWY
ncbi:MAG: ubiquitin-like domain-containing protein [Candidatus Saccharimonadales bacterium]